MNRVTHLIVVSVLVTVVLLVSFDATAAYLDVAGTKYEWSVTVLADLEIMKGFEDGTFRSGNPITRAEFAAVTVRACGLGNAARFVVGATPYPDVPSGHWASGYVNVASDRGFIQGFPDGSFRPAEFVSHAEVITVLVRILGYQDLTEGAWPGNYLRAAASIGLITSPPPQPSARASRGDVAMMVTTAISLPVSEQTALQIDSEQLIGNIPGVTEVTGIVIDTWLRANSGLQQGEITVRAGTRRRTLDASKVSGVKDLLGRNVSAWVDSNSTVILLKQSTEQGQVVEGILHDGYVSGGVLTSVRVGGVRYSISPDVVLYNNFQLTNNINQRVDQWASGKGRAVLDESGKALFLEAVTYDGSWVVLEYCAVTHKLVVSTDDGMIEHVYLSQYAGVVGVGAASDQVPLRMTEGNLVYHATTDRNVLYLHLVASPTQGLCEAVSADKIVVDGWEYLIGSATMSLDDHKSIDLPGIVSVTALLGNRVNLYLDLSGNLRHIRAQAMTAPPSQQGMLLTDVHSQGSVRSMLVLDSDGRIRRYRLAPGATVLVDQVDSSGSTDHLRQGTFVEYRLWRQGEVDQVRVLTVGDSIKLEPDTLNSHERLLWTGKRWSRFQISTCVFTLHMKTVLTPVGLPALSGDIVVHPVQSRPAVVEALALDTISADTDQKFAAAVITGWSPDRDRLYVRTVMDLLDIPVDNIDPAIDIAGVLPGSLVLMRAADGGSVDIVVPETGTVRFRVDDITPHGMYLVGTDGRQQFALVDESTVVVDLNTGGMWQSQQAAQVGHSVLVYDVDGNGIVDFVIVQPANS